MYGLWRIILGVVDLLSHTVSDLEDGGRCVGRKQKARMRAESLTRQCHVLQTIWPAIIVRIDDSSSRVVVVGRLSRISSSNSGIAKTSAGLELESIILDSYDGRYHMCYTMYSLRVCGLHLLSSAASYAARASFQRSIEV